MKKSDLRTGMRVTLRDGSVYFVFKDVPVGDDYFDILCMGDDYLILDDYDENLCDCDNRKYDIVKIEIPMYIPDVFNPESKYYKVIWERPIREITLREIEKELGCTVRIIGGTD